MPWSSTSRTGRLDRRTPDGRRSSFLARWVLAVAASMLVGGLVEHLVATEQLRERMLAEATDTYSVEVGPLERALALPAWQRPAAVRAVLLDVSRSRGTRYVGLFDAAGRPVHVLSPGSTDPEAVDADRLAAVLATRTPSVAAEEDADEAADEARYEFLLPVRGPDGLLVLEIDQEAEVLGGLLADLRSSKALGLLVAVLVAVPLSYLLGGRTLHRQHQRSAREADTDALTGLAGRRPFRPELSAALAEPATPVCLALLDLDGFKQINDRLGHSYGDRVLVALAAALRKLRAGDRAFRLGGDEFAVLLPDADDARAHEVLEGVRAAFAHDVPGVSFSCGVAVSPAGAPLDLQELWERSDSALYEAKRLGRNRTVTFTTMSTRYTVSNDKLDAVSRLLRADSPISVAFQPIWDLTRGVVLAHEALLRLPPGCGVTGPQEAFELAQRLGLAAGLDARARAAVLDAVRARQWSGLLFLNVHPDALAVLDVDALAGELAGARLVPADVVLEVTEQAGLDEPQPVRVLKRAHERGFRLALDDMGQSNAGLRALTHVPFDVVKLDRSVVARLGADPASAATVAAALTFVQQTGGWVIAEGIEDVAMLRAVRDGARPRAGAPPVLAGQGYLLGRPAAAPLEPGARVAELPAPGERRVAVPAAPGPGASRHVSSPVS